MSREEGGLIGLIYSLAPPGGGAAVNRSMFKADFFVPSYFINLISLNIFAALPTGI